MDIDINTRQKLKSSLHKWMKDCFGRTDKIEEFDIFEDLEKLACVVRGDEGFIFGSDETSGDNYAVYVSDKMQLMLNNGFSCSAKQYSYNERRENKVVRVNVCGFYFQAGQK